VKASSCDFRPDCYLKLLLEHDYDFYRMSYALVNDYSEMMMKKIWINRAFGDVYGRKTFLIWGCLAFLARGVYIGWAGQPLNVFLQM
jgi:hypothetical protein